MARLRMFAAARVAAGTGSAEFDGSSVADVLDAAVEAFGAEFAAQLAQCKIWVNGAPAETEHAVNATDEVAVLPPVSGG